MKNKKSNFIGKRFTAGHTLIVIIISLFAIVCVYPFLLTISGSFTSASDALEYGYRLFPKHISSLAYNYVVSRKKVIIRSYGVTIFVTVFGTVASLAVNSLSGFAISRKNMKFRRIINFYVLFTILFSGGMVPWYLICVNVYKLKDSIFAMILPCLASAWNVFLFRNYFASIPDEMYESAKIDGAGDFRIYCSIYLKLSAPVIATVTLFTGLGFWTSWYQALMLIDNSDLHPLQLLLRNLENELRFLKNASLKGGANSQLIESLAELPDDSVKMAMVIVTTGPILLLYPFIQRYFVKGIMVGAVKG